MIAPAKKPAMPSDDKRWRIVDATMRQRLSSEGMAGFLGAMHLLYASPL